jgi:hypothetical protein
MILFASREDSKKRYSICNSCDNFLHKTKMCKKCRCYMPIKVILANAMCPISQWTIVNHDKSITNGYEVEQ